MKRLLFAFLLGMSIAPQAYADFESVVSTIVETIRSHKKQITRPVDVYSYHPRAEVGIPDEGEVSADDPRFSTFVQRKSQMFWKVEEQDWNLFDTDGLYAAIDPVVSRVYGKSDWALFRITLPIGYSYLDLTEIEYDRDIYKPVLTQQSELGCDPDRTWSFRQLLMTNTGGVACKKIALEVFKRLQVNSIMYLWTAFNFRFCPDRKNPAFVLLNLPDQLNSVRAFTAEIPEQDPDRMERVMIESLFAQATQAVILEPSIPPKSIWPWPQLDQAASQVDVATWARHHLLYCN